MEQKLSLINKIFISAIIFTILFLGNFFIGPITARNLLGIFLVFYSILKSNMIKVGKIVIAYLLYLGILTICSFMSGVIFTETAIKGFTYHFISISIILSFPIIFNSKIKIIYACASLTIFYLLNCFISILQFSNVSLAWDISTFLNPQSGERYSMFTDVYGENSEMLNHSILTGLFGFVVTNGYFTASLLPLVTAPLIDKNNKDKIFYWIFLCIGLYTIYIIQQRMGFVVGLLYLFTILSIGMKRSAKIYFACFVIIIMVLFGDIFSNIDLGRLTDQNDSYRTQIWDIFIENLNSEYFLIGGFDLSNEFLGKVLGHNCILDAFRRGGLITMLSYVVTFFIIAIFCFRQIKIAYKDHGCLSFGLWSSALFYMIYSLTHSSGIQSGDPSFWMLASLGLSLIYCDNHTKRIRI